MFFSRSFIVLRLTFRSLISFELVFVYIVQFYYFACECCFPDTIVEGTVFSPLSSLESLVQDHLTIYARVYFWAFYPFPLVHMSVLNPLLPLVVRKRSG